MNDHPITIEPLGARLKVLYNGTTVVDTAEALVMRESIYPPVYYVPRKDADMSVLESTDHSTYCPHKGDASYYSLTSGGETAQNAVWIYEEPIESVAEIRDHIAFYGRYVTFEVEGEPAEVRSA